MPVFSALMTSAFGSEDPFGILDQNDRFADGDDVRVLPEWVAEALERDITFQRIVR